MLRSLLPAAITVLLLGILWWALVTFLATPEYLVPSPLRTAEALGQNGPELIAACWHTARVTLYGVALALFAALLLATVSFFVARDESSFVGVLIVLQSIPVVVLAPLLNIWLGNAELARVTVSALFALFPLTVAFVRALHEVPPDLVVIARAFGCKRGQLFWSVRLPWAWSGFFTGLRVAVPLALVGAIVAELSGSDVGIGFLMQQAQRRLDMSLLFAGIICSAVLGILGYVAVAFAERLALPWRRSTISS